MERRSLLSKRIVISSLLRSPEATARFFMGSERFRKWVHLDLNQGPTGYEPDALTAELWTRESPIQGESAVYHSRASSPGVRSPGRNSFHLCTRSRASSAVRRGS